MEPLGSIRSRVSLLFQPMVTRGANLIPGLVLAGLSALVAVFIASKSFLPSAFLALIVGMAISTYGVHRRFQPGLTFVARDVLRVGVALLGATITFSQLLALGMPVVLLIAIAVALTASIGTLIARALGLSWGLSAILAGAVAVCGASAAMAIAAACPLASRRERDIAAVVAGVTICGTAAMLLYPAIARLAGFDAMTTGIFLGGSLHEVAQAVGAGYGVSQTVGQVAVSVKLLRVACLAPIVFATGLMFRIKGASHQRNTPLLPVFLLAFLILMVVRNAGYISEAQAGYIGAVSQACLLTSLAGLGLKTSFSDFLGMGPGPAIALAAQTLLLTLIVMIGLII